MDDKEIKEFSNTLMGCGCTMFLIPIFGLFLILGIMMLLSIAGIIK